MPDLEQADVLVVRHECPGGTSQRDEGASGLL